MAAKSNKALTFEQAISRMEKIAELLEHPDTGLEETIRLVEEGLRISKECRALLDAAELRIKVLENPAGAATSAPRHSQPPPADQVEQEFSLI